MATVTRQAVLNIAEKHGYTLRIEHRKGVWISKNGKEVYKRRYMQAYLYMYDQNKKR